MLRQRLGIVLATFILLGLGGPEAAQAFVHDKIKKKLEDADKAIKDLGKGVFPETGTSSSKAPPNSGAAGWSEPGTPGTDIYFKKAFNKVLESARTGSETSWRNPKTGDQGVITPTATFNEADGTPCRNYRWTLVAGASSRLFEGTACRAGTYKWQVKQETEQQPTVAGTGSSDTPWLSGQSTGAQGAATSQSNYNHDKQMVADAQRMLNQLNYNAGVVDGLYGKKTRVAIRAFHQDRGLPAGGNVTPQVLAQLSQETQGQGGWPGTAPSPQIVQAPSATGSPSQGGGWSSTQGTAGGWTGSQQATGGGWSGGQQGAAGAASQGGGWIAQPPGGGVVAQAPGGGLIAQPPGGGMIAQPPGGGLVAQPPSGMATTAPAGGFAAQAPSTGQATPPPANMAALAQKFGLRTLHGRLMIGVVGSAANEIKALERFFTLIRLGLNPEASEPLCMANLFLSEKQKSRILEPQVSPKTIYGTDIRIRPWKGTGQNEFAVDRAKNTYVTELLPQIVANTPRLPLEFIYVTSSHLLSYDMKRGGFPVEGIPQSQIGLPRIFCYGIFTQNSYGKMTHLPFATKLPTFWALDPQTAEQKIIGRIPVRDARYTPRRDVFAATNFTLSAAPSAKTKDKYQGGTGLTPLVVTVKSVGLYEDPDLERPLHTFELEAPAAPPVLLTGVPETAPTPKQVVLNEETVTLLLLKQRGDVLDRRAWKKLLSLHRRNDKAYYKREKIRNIGGAYRTLKLKTFDPDYIPFFPNGFDIGNRTSLTDEQLETFRQWSLKRAAALPNRFVLRTQLTHRPEMGSSQKIGAIKIDLGSFRANDRSPLLAGLVGRGYVPGQIVSPDLNRLSNNSKFDVTLTTGQGKSRVPIFVLANLLKTYVPQFSQAQGQKLFGDWFSSGQWRADIELDLVVQQTEQLGIDDKTEAFVIHAQPVAIRFLNNDASAVLYQQAYQVAALDPNQSSAASLTVSQPSQAKMPFSAEVADLLMVKFLPATLDQAATERMILARWHYETSFNRRSEEPQWGRFFVEGKPKPNAQQRAELAPQFKNWTLKRAQAMSTVVTVVFSQAQTSKPGPIKLGQGLFDYRFFSTPMGMETKDCQFKARSTRSSKPALAETHDRACAFLKDASTILGPEIYVAALGGSAHMSLSLKNRSRLLQKNSSLYQAGVGPRLNCGRAVYGDDKYCRAMLEELRGDLFGKSFELDDVLVIDKEIIVPDNRPDITVRSSMNRAVELDVEIVGVRRVNRLPPHPFLTAYRQFEDFVQKAGLRSGGGQWTSMFEQETVPLFLLDARVREARLVEKTKNSRKVIAKLPLGEPRVPDASLLKIVEPERLAGPSELYGPDVIGLRLGMSFEEADRIIRDQMKVGRSFVADRVWQTKAATGDIEPFTSGRLYEAQDGSEVIIIFDEPPAATGVVLGLVRQVSFPKGKVPPAAIVASLEKKYGKASGSDSSGGGGQLWYEGLKGNQKLPIRYCRPSYNAAEKLSIWRNTDGSATDWKPTTLRYSGSTPSLRSFQSSRPSDAASCPTGLSATFDTRQNSKWDRLVIRLFDQRVYAEQYQESKRLIEKGEGGTSTVDTGLDLKL